MNMSTDKARWTNKANLLPAWDERTRKLARLVPPGSSVLEFGAGRRKLEDYLPPYCRYTPSDLVERGRGTMVVDLNVRPLPDIPYFDVVVFGGVLEYVSIIPVVDWIRNYTRVIIASYAVTDLNPEPMRAANGWVTNFSNDGMFSVFQTNGFKCRHVDTWQRQHIYFCKRVRNIRRESE